LLGATAEVTDLAQAGRVVLGTDSRLSGERGLLEELKIAAATQQVSAVASYRMVTVDAAAILRLPRIGRLEPSGPADLLALPFVAPDPFSSVLAAARAGVRLVMIEGQACVGNPDMQPVFESTRVDAAEVRVDEHRKLMADRLVSRLRKSGVKEAGLTIYKASQNTVTSQEGRGTARRAPTLSRIVTILREAQ
jgi:adenine deaminase